MANDYHEANRLSWNAATHQHHTHRPDLIERYRNGYNNLFAEDMQLLGDLTGKTVVHLQCNDGQDTLSIARHVGGTLTGVDISDTAISFARNLAEQTGIHANFIRSDIFDWFDTNTTLFDVVYTSYGAICWISDVIRWAQGIARTLKPGGRLVMVEFHPIVGMLEVDWTPAYDYMGGNPQHSGGVGDYVGDDYEGQYSNPHSAYEFAWGVSEIYNALIAAGLKVSHFQEYPYCNGWKPFPNMREVPGRRNYPPEGKPTIAMMFSFVANKPE